MAKASDYITQYLNQAKEISASTKWPKYVQNFFKTFHASLKKNTRAASQGDRYFVERSLSDAFYSLFPESYRNCSDRKTPTIKRNVNILEYMNHGFPLKIKKMDFVIKSKKGLYFIEVKTSLQFNDFSAAMVEMFIIKKHIKKEINFKTSSLHLFPYTTGIKGLLEVNKDLGSPIQNVFILCQKEKIVVFQPEKLIELKKDITNFHASK